MGCLRNKLIEVSEVAVGVDPVEVMLVPEGATEGQMDFFNTGATSIALRLAQNKGNASKSTVAIAGPYTILLLAGKTFTEDGVIPGAIVAVSSAAGGKFSGKVSYR